MSLEQIREALLCCTLINFGLLALWAILLLLPHEWMQRLWSKWFRISVEQFDAINFAGIVFYKIAIILFCLTPYLALRIVG